MTRTLFKEGKPQDPAESSPESQTADAVYLRAQQSEDSMRLVAEGLGWLSIGLGTTEILFPQSISRWLGVKDSPLLLRALGIREIVSGLGILLSRRPATWLWSRVAGDAVDLALLAAACRSPDARHDRIGAAAGAVAAIGIADVLGSIQQPDRNPIQVKQSITINASPQAVYQFWKKLDNLPRFMRHLESVRPTGAGRSLWVASGPAGMKYQWETQMTTDEPNHRIKWHSLPGADLHSIGNVVFQEAFNTHGTVVRVEMEYLPPAGSIGPPIAAFFGREPSQQLHDDLRRLKQLLETGEVITTEGQPAGRCHSLSWRYDSTAVSERESWL